MTEPTIALLGQGSRLGIVSPASAANAELVSAGIANLEAHGYRTTLLPHALARGPLYYAGSARQRAADLMTAFADDTVEGILCTRGGWGSAELLPLLDATVVRANPKPFIGYSDHTSLHTWLWTACGLRSFYAPMVAADWARTGGVHLPSWRAALEGQGRWQAGAADGLRVLREGHAHSSVEGRLLGGCLSLLTEGLGTPWAMRIDEPCILFVEDIGTKAYQWDRMVQHLRFAGLLQLVRGVVFGDMSANGDESEQPLIEAACLHALSGFDGPVQMGLRCGHVADQNRSLPLGAWVRLEGAEMMAL